MDRDNVYIKHILDAILCVQEYVAGKTKEDFLSDHKTADAVAFQIGIIGETANRVSDEGRVKYPNVPWHKVRGMRNRLFHDYLGTDWDVVWETATTALPELREQLLRSQ